MDKKGQLEVEIIRARGLVVKPGSKTLPGKSRRDSSIIAHNPHFAIQRLCFLLAVKTLFLGHESIICGSLRVSPEWASARVDW